MLNLSEVSTEDLHKELIKRNVSADILRVKNTIIEGITSKDITIVYGKEQDSYNGEETWRFAPHFTNRKGKLEFCYDHPLLDYTDFALFLPEGFSETEECIYDFYKGSITDALNLLEECGFKVKRDDDFFWS